jgi:hypothetical protein
MPREKTITYRFSASDNRGQLIGNFTNDIRILILDSADRHQGTAYIDNLLEQNAQAVGVMYRDWPKRGWYKNVGARGDAEEWHYRLQLNDNLAMLFKFEEKRTTHLVLFHVDAPRAVYRTEAKDALRRRAMEVLGEKS